MASLQMKLRKLGQKGKLDNKGIFGIESVAQFITSILGLGILFFVVLVIINSLLTSTALPAGSYVKNTSDSAFNNITAGIGTFASNYPIFFSLVVVVVIILIVAVVLAVLRSLEGRATRGGALG